MHPVRTGLAPNSRNTTMDDPMNIDEGNLRDYYGCMSCVYALRAACSVFQTAQCSVLMDRSLYYS